MVILEFRNLGTFWTYNTLVSCNSIVVTEVHLLYRGAYTVIDPKTTHSLLLCGVVDLSSFFVPAPTFAPRTFTEGAFSQANSPLDVGAPDIPWLAKIASVIV